MNGAPARLYLDDAATSWPKPDVVVSAVSRWFAEYGVSADRGDAARCAEVRRIVDAARAGVATICGVPQHRVAFTSGATEGLNLLLRGLLNRGDRVVTTAIEHSSVVRPLVALAGSLDLDVAVAPCDTTGTVDPFEVDRLLRERRTRLVVISHASNVTGAIQALAPIRAAAEAAGALLMVDASQTAGIVPIDGGADLIAASAHKGLLAPPGLGFVAVREGVDVRAGKQGGTGASIALERHPEAWPTAFEAGTPNTPALFGLAAALRWLDGIDRQTLRVHQLAIVDALHDRLTSLPSARVFAPGPDRARLPILSFVLGELDPAEAGLLLDAHGIEVRTGFHCAPWIHRPLGTELGGTIRISPGPFVSADAPRRVAAALGLA